MSRQRKRGNKRKPTPNLRRERADRRARMKFRAASGKLRNTKIGGVELKEDPFGIFDELEEAQSQTWRS